MFLKANYYGVKYVKTQHAEHLIKCIQNVYPVPLESTGELYCEVSLDWDYKHKHVTLSMLGYVEGAMHEYQHKNPTKPLHEPHKWERPDYGAKKKWASNESNKPIITTEKRKYIQKLVGKFLYYEIAVELTMLMALGTLAPAQ